MLCYNNFFRRMVGALLLMAPSLTWGHPHSFISMQVTPVSKDNQLTGLKMHWVMDEITSADLLYDAGNAKLGSEVWKKLAAGVMANVLEQHYFSEFWHEGKAVKFYDVPPEYKLFKEGHKAVLEFILPLSKPQPLAGQRYTFSTFDPTYFVDMSYDSEKSLRLPPELAQQCKLTLHVPKPNESMKSYALSLDKADAPPEEMDLGRQFAQAVTLACQ